jgi:hypothetical protein
MMSDTVTRKEYFKKSMPLPIVEQHGQLKIFAGAKAYKVVDQGHAWILVSEWDAASETVECDNR